MTLLGQPYLDVHFKPADEATTAVVNNLYEYLDKRLKAVKNWKACHSIICGILALKWADSFAVTRANLSAQHKEAFDAVAEALTGTLIQRAGGRNLYRVHPHFAANTTVVDTRPSDFRFRVQGVGVNYASQQSIQSAKSVSLINGYHAVPLRLSEVGNIVEYQWRGLDLPDNYYSALEPLELSPNAYIIANSYRTYIQSVMQRFGYVGLLVNSTDENAFDFVVMDAHADGFPSWLYQVSLPFWKSQKLSDGRSLKSVTFPAAITRKDGRLQVIKGQSVQPLLERMANG